MMRDLAEHAPPIDDMAAKGVGVEGEMQRPVADPSAHDFDRLFRLRDAVRDVEFDMFVVHRASSRNLSSGARCAARGLHVG